MNHLVEALLVALAAEKIKAAEDAVCLFWKNWRAKKSNSTLDQLCEAIQKYFGIEQEAALRVIASLHQKKVIKIKGKEIKGESISIETTDGEILLEDSNLVTPKASIRMIKEKKKYNDEDDGSNCDVFAGGAEVELTTEGRVKLKA